ncbi:MAG TPA: diaminopimelate decarboxylase, partial [Candidatus Melainabacteria bacterium]|nr:diaminopimelate decarboxylase [Candidatus Melainabacteria bacterium]
MVKSSSMSTSVLSPNTRLMPVTAEVSPEHHLMLGGCDTVKLAERWGTPLWVMDYDTIKASAEALKAGLAVYPGAKALYA